jgi:hypothetical protein
MLTTLRENWFWPLAVGLVAFVWAMSTIPTVPLTPDFEWALLFDVFITLPVLFAFCYRGTMTRVALGVRIVALQCSGIWLATKLVPVESQMILPHLEWLRWAGLAILLLFEIRLVVAVVKLVWNSSAKQADLVAVGMPPFVAKLAMIEARFWRWVFRRSEK